MSHPSQRARSVSGPVSPSAAAPRSHASAHAPQRMQRVPRTISSGPGAWLSGLWHHQQESAHPLRKTVVRMPGPSWIE